MSNTSKLTFWQQDCSSRICWRFLSFAFVNRVVKQVRFHAGNVPFWTRGHSPCGYLQRARKLHGTDGTSWRAKRSFLGWGETLLSSLVVSLRRIFLLELIFLQKALAAVFLRHISVRFICSMEILILCLEIRHKINFSCWKLEYFNSVRLLQCQEEWWLGWLVLPFRQWQGSPAEPPAPGTQHPAALVGSLPSQKVFLLVAAIFLQSPTPLAVNQHCHPFMGNNCGFQPKKIAARKLFCIDTDTV